MTTDEHLVDAASFQPTQDHAGAPNPLEWPRYEEALKRVRASSTFEESVATGPATIGGHLIELAVFDFSFFGGSMGAVAGERLARSLERAAAGGTPFVLATATGGARMQEGMAALVQMPKVVAARLDLARAHVPFIAVLGHPTTGGVLASLAALADVTVAEEGATIGFAGPRIVERFTGRPLAGSHTAATALAAGLVDVVVPAAEIGNTVGHVLHVLGPDDPTPVEPRVASDAGAASRAIEPSTPDAWTAVQSARLPERPRGPDLLGGALEAHAVLQGDRAGREDPALVLALGRLAGRRVVGMALDRSFYPGPSAYRKAVRGLELAARLGVPVVTLVDTPGANPSEASENGGIASAIARLFSSMLTVPVPVVCVVTGEGGSGGALAFATSDVLLAYEGAVFSVIAPEMAAEILWRDPTRAPEAARLLRPTARELLHLGIADDVIPEPLGPGSLKRSVAYHLALLGGVAGDELVAARRRRWRNRGEEQTSASEAGKGQA